MNGKLFPLCVLLLTTLVQPSFAEHTLLQVQVLHRHGDRTPIRPNPPTCNVDWVKWLGVPMGHLTGLGITQTQQLGSWVRDRYVRSIPLLSPSYNSTQVHVQASQYDRTIMTASALLSGLFPNITRRDDVHNTNATAFVPIHTVIKTNDYVIRGYDNCGTARTRVLNDLYASDMWRAKEEQTQELLSWFRNVTGFENVSLQGFVEQYDPVFVMHVHNVLCDAISPRIREIRALADWTELSRVQALGRLSGGGMFGAIANAFDNFLNGSLPNPKFIQYSAHDTTIMSLLVTMELDTTPLFQGIPPYASALFLELWKPDTPASEPYVLIHYRDGVSGNVSMGIANMTITQLRALAERRAMRTAQSWCEACGDAHNTPAWDPATAPDVCLRFAAHQGHTSSSATTPQRTASFVTMLGSPSPWLIVALVVGVYGVGVSAALMMLVPGHLRQRQSRRYFRTLSAFEESLLEKGV